MLEGGPLFIVGRVFIIRLWSEELDIQRKNMSMLPIWVKLYDIPKQLWTKRGKGNISNVGVEYMWIPSTCAICNSVGYKEAKCPKTPTTGTVNVMRGAEPILVPEGVVPIAEAHTVWVQDQHAKSESGRQNAMVVYQARGVQGPVDQNLSIIQSCEEMAMAQATDTIVATIETAPLHVQTVPAMIMGTNPFLALSDVNEDLDEQVAENEEIDISEIEGEQYAAEQEVFTEMRDDQNPQDLGKDLMDDYQVFTDHLVPEKLLSQNKDHPPVATVTRETRSQKQQQLKAINTSSSASSSGKSKSKNQQQSASQSGQST
ncbi:hypothetical protein IFM89_038457 [Coptis chinensis]|uniref:DUF4283 domain-containing protein n=1 Tax=Coptis chinensis TaxID=261450 RepID=A0A835HAA0_9MAGN|nr:hypothetical protein IFM89_038457 [Coptis chinensis]